MVCPSSFLMFRCAWPVGGGSMAGCLGPRQQNWREEGRKKKNSPKKKYKAQRKTKSNKHTV